MTFWTQMSNQIRWCRQEGKIDEYNVAKRIRIYISSVLELRQIAVRWLANAGDRYYMWPGLLLNLASEESSKLHTILNPFSRKRECLIAQSPRPKPGVEVKAWEPCSKLVECGRAWSGRVWWRVAGKTILPWLGVINLPRGCLKHTFSPSSCCLHVRV